jgi:hypothetical protein
MVAGHARAEQIERRDGRELLLHQKELLEKGSGVLFQQIEMLERLTPLLG